MAKACSFFWVFIYKIYSITAMLVIIFAYFIATLCLFLLPGDDLSATHLPSLMSSMNASPACFCSEFCHSCEHSSITSSTTDWPDLKVAMPFPSESSSWPWLPISVLLRKDEKSTMISRSSGEMELRATSSFRVRLASRVGVGSGAWRENTELRPGAQWLRR